MSSPMDTELERLGLAPGDAADIAAAFPDADPLAWVAALDVCAGAMRYGLDREASPPTLEPWASVYGGFLGAPGYASLRHTADAVLEAQWPGAAFALDALLSSRGKSGTLAGELVSLGVSGLDARPIAAQFALEPVTEWLAGLDLTARAVAREGLNGELRPTAAPWATVYDAMQGRPPGASVTDAITEAFADNWPALQLELNAAVYARFADLGATGPAAAQAQPAAWKLRGVADAYASAALPTEYVCEPLLPRPGLAVVYGTPGSFKSLACYDLAACVATGAPWLESQPGASPAEPGFPTRQAPVLIVDCDQGARETARRVAAVGQARGLAAGVALHYYSAAISPPDARSWAKFQPVAAAAQSIGAELVVLDNLGALTDNGDENAGAVMVPTMRNLRRLAEEVRAAVVVLHHPRKSQPGTHGGNKQDSLRGHGSIAGALDLALLFERDGDADTVAVHPTKVRGSPVGRFGARFEYEHRPGSTDLLRARFWGVPDARGPAAIRAAILAAVAATPGLNKSELVRAVGAALPAQPRPVGVNTIRAAIDRAAQRGEVEARPGAGTAVHYYEASPLRVAASAQP